MKRIILGLITVMAISLAAVFGPSVAQASGLVGGHDIKPGAVHRYHLSNGLQSQLSRQEIKLRNQNVGLPKGAYVSVAVYDNGGNGWATVACNKQTDFAIDGQIEAGDPVGNGGPVGSYVIASFQGRMDFTGDANNNTPKPGRTDGWIFGLHADANGATDTPLIVSTICVPNVNVKTVVNHY